MKRTPLKKKRGTSRASIEVFRYILQYEGLYAVSNLGRIISIKRKTTKGGILKQNDLNKYRDVVLCKDNKARHFLVHRLVAIAFVPNPNNYPQINHKNGNKKDNQSSNLEWCTPQENITHALKVLGKRHDGEFNPTSKLTAGQVKEIKKIHQEFPNKYATEVAPFFNVSRHTISRIWRGDTWVKV